MCVKIWNWDMRSHLEHNILPWHVQEAFVGFGFVVLGAYVTSPVSSVISLRPFAQFNPLPDDAEGYQFGAEKKRPAPYRDML